MSRTRPVILVAVKGLGIGGAETLIASSARLWDRDRYEYHVAYALPWKDQLAARIAAEGVPVHCFGSPRGMTPASWWRLRDLARSTGTSVVHAHLPAVGAVARLVAPAPVVYTEHNIAGSYRRPVQIANRATYRRNRAVTAVSEAVAASVAAYPGPAARVVPNGVDVSVEPAAAAAARAELGIAPEARLVAHVGNIRPHKGHENLVEAVRVLAATRTDVHVVSAGGEKNDGDLARVRRLAVEAGVADRLTFLGRRPDALAFVGAAEMLVNPSDFEGLPVAVLEAMALGKPVVATAVGGVPSVVDAATGILVPPRDPGALAGGIVRLLDDPALAAALGAAGREVVERHHGLEAMVRAYEAIYDEVLR